MSGASNASGQDEQHPFRLPWVNSCYHQTLLPDAPWHKLEGRVAQLLATRVERQFSHPQRKEMLLELLGRHFVDTYLSHVERNPQVLDASHMGGEEYDRLRIEATSWLNNQMYKAVKDAGLQSMLTGAASSDTDTLPPDYAAFLQHTFTVFASGLERELFKQERDLRERKERELLNPKKAQNADIFKVPAPSRLKPLSTMGSSSSASSVPKPTSAQLRGMIHTVQGDPPPMWGHQSDCIGAGVVALLQRDPRKFDHVAGRLHGRQLPGTLRAYMWADVLLKQERKRMKEVYAEKVVREKFARAVARGLTELRIKKPTESPINGLIQNAVIETYSKTVSMLPYKQVAHLKESARALNVLYVYDRSYEPYLINWLFPLQIAFRDKDQHQQDHGEHVLELGMYLDLLNTSCYPSWPEVFAIAECVMQRLQDEDPDLHDHLRHIATINVQGHPKEFLVHLIHREKEKAEALLQSVPNTARSLDQSAQQLLADPLIFLRRWIGEGFVSVVDTPAVMYIWDQCFLQCWSHSVLQNVCLALLELLRYRFMEARNYVQMKEVFLNEACKLYTVDIQMAWIHVENGKPLMEIYNRQQPSLPGSRMSGAPSQATTPAPGLLQTFGIKHLKAKLIIPAETIQREQWLMSLDPAGLSLCSNIYFGSIQLNRRLSTNTPKVLSAAKDTYGNMVYELEFPGERYVYPNFDLSPYDVERELGASPYAIISIEYKMPSTSKSKGLNLIPLGWSRVLLFRGEGTMSVDNFNLIEGETWVALHPGDIPDSLISTQPATPSETQEDAYLGYNSELGALVFDPNREPRTPQPQIPPLDIPPQSRQVPPADTRRQPPPPSQRTPRQPKPPPVVQPPTQRSPPPPSVPAPRSVPRAAAPDPWVAYDPRVIASNPAPTSAREPFDIYVDSVRYIPDNATIVKVTGRLLKAGNLTNLQDVLALPVLGESARCPQFDFRMTVNAERQRANPDMLLLLRVYTVDINTEQVVVIGSCLLKVFDTKKKEGTLRVGGHQLRLHSGMPDVKQGINNLKETDLDPAPVIPGCSILVRILPHSQELQPPPASGYKSGYYQSASCKPTQSEKRIFESYADHMAYPQTERDMVLRLQDSEGRRAGGRDDSALLEWLQDRLDIKKQTAAAKAADNLSLIHCVRYRIKMGLSMKANKAFNLPDNLYIVCVAQVLPGGQAVRMSPTGDGFGKNDPVILSRLKRDGLLQAPQWEGEPQVIHPFYDDNSVLVVRLLGIPLKYIPTHDNKSAGTLALSDGGELKIVEENVIGWTVIPLFDGNSVQAGTHHVPVFRGDITQEIIGAMRTTAPKDVIAARSWGRTNMHMAASLALTLWDAHFDYNELPVVPTYTVLEEAAGDAQACQAARNKSGTLTGSRVSDIVLNNLPPKIKKQGVKGAVYQKEHGFFDEVVASSMPAAVMRALSDGVMVRL